MKTPLILFALSILFPFSEDQATVDVAESESGLGDDLEAGHVHGLSGDFVGEALQFGMDILAVCRGMDEPPVDLQDGGDAFDGPGGAEAVSDQ